MTDGSLPADSAMRELTAMKDVYGALRGLESPAVRRVLEWAAAQFQVEPPTASSVQSRTGAAVVSPEHADHHTNSGPYATIADLFAAAMPESNSQIELAVYQRLTTRRIHRLQGFSIPALLDYDDGLRVLELSLVFPPFVLDFAAAGLDARPAGFDPDDPAWQAWKRRLSGRRAQPYPCLVERLCSRGPCSYRPGTASDGGCGLACAPA